MSAARALWRDHRKRLDVPLMLVFAATSLYFGLSTPLIRVEKAIVLSNEYSVWSGVVGLWEEGDYLLAAVVFFFSFVFPIAKLLLVGAVWCTPVALERRTAWLSMLETLGRWSMLDVFVVAILIVATKLEPLASVYPRPGVHWFLAAVLVSMVVTHRVRLLASNGTGEDLPDAETRSRPRRSDSQKADSHKADSPKADSKEASGGG